MRRDHLTECLVEGCTLPPFGRGWCYTHYRRWRAHGNTDISLRLLPAEERFWAKVDKSGECWQWAGVHAQGYGRCWWNGHSAAAHRVAFELTVGPVPEGLELDHLCRNRGCVNPAHLEPVTRRENARRAAAVHDTGHCPQGHPFDEANTYRHRGTGWRVCRQCRADKERSRQAYHRSLAAQQTSADGRLPSDRAVPHFG